MATPNIYGSTDIYAPVEQAQKFAEQQNALARQKAVRNALGNAIDPRTGRTNWEFARQIGGADVAPELQQMQQADMAAQAELFHKRAQGQKAATDAETAYWSQQRDTAARIGDQPSWSVWRSSLPAEFQQFVPEQYSPENQRMTLATADKALELYKPDIQFQDTAAGVEGIDVSPYSPTYKKTVIQREAAPKSAGVNINMGAAETEFGKSVAGAAAKNLDDSFKGARSASSSFSNIERLTPLLNSKEFISGTLGNPRLAVAKAFGLEGAEETQTFFSQMGRETAETIKSFGAGTGLSDNDRIYAEKIAGGNVDLTPGAIKRILFLRQQANRAAIIQYNDERRAASVNNPKAKLDQYYREIPVPPPPSYDYRGWRLETDAKGNSAYVSPDRKSFQETR